MNESLWDGTFFEKEASMEKEAIAPRIPPLYTAKELKAMKKRALYYRNLRKQGLKKALSKQYNIKDLAVSSKNRRELMSDLNDFITSQLGDPADVMPPLTKKASSSIEKNASVYTEARGTLKLLLPHLPASLQTRIGKSALMALMTPMVTKEGLKRLSGKKRGLLQRLSPSVAAHDYMKRWQYAAAHKKTIGQVDRALAREKKMQDIIQTVVDPKKRDKALRGVMDRIKK